MKANVLIKIGIVAGSVSGLHFLFLPQIALAVLPPDLIVSAGAQVVGIFSLIIAVVVSAIAGLGVLFFSFFDWFKKRAVLIAFTTLAVVLIVSNGVFLWMFHHNPQIATPIENKPSDTEIVAPTTACDTCMFYSDSITIFIPDPVSAQVIELDLNRRQEPNETFSHYYFLDGVISGTPLDQYVQFNSPVSTLKEKDFLSTINIVEPTDGSLRTQYTGEITTESDTSIKFETSALSGDFVTRNTPEYTQFQSVAAVEVILDNKVKTAYGLVENLHSTDFEKSIFFLGYDSVESLTHQFVLWDEDGNFYLIDDSQVFSDTPAYPSHSWLLYKESVSGFTKKGFETTVTNLSENQWQVTVPDFHTGVISVRSIQQYQTDVNGRSRYIVSGTIVDEKGERALSGLLRIVK